MINLRIAYDRMRLIRIDTIVLGGKTVSLIMKKELEALGVFLALISA